LDSQRSLAWPSSPGKVAVRIPLSTDILRHSTLRLPSTTTVTMGVWAASSSLACPSFPEAFCRSEVTQPASLSVNVAHRVSKETSVRGWTGGTTLISPLSRPVRSARSATSAGVNARL